MSQNRTIKKVIAGKRAVDGAGVRLVRVFGHDDVKDFDPFLMLDAFDSVHPEDYTKGFPWHPHRGIETITYLIHGDIEHGDSLGNSGSILDGDCQWMTSGSGIIHQEMPKESPRMLGVQLWLNMPAEFKMAPPKYHGITKDTIPVIQDGNAVVHVIAGKFKGVDGASKGDYVQPFFYDVELQGGAEWSFDTDPQDTLFLYIVQGGGRFEKDSDREIAEKNAVLLDSGDNFWVKASDRGIRFLFLGGKPLKEPIAWGGPIVMNTQEELEQAFMELNKNTFIKK